MSMLSGVRYNLRGTSSQGRLRYGERMKIAEVETLDHLREYMAERLPTAKVVYENGEVLIKTGLDIDLGNYLYPIDSED